ncbi:MAG: T9SS type A sorting domain-containing protein [Maribacter sp.]|nr:T9SS type A sorting domain-containing protein [Maribacter sp.]
MRHYYITIVFLFLTAIVSGQSNKIFRLHLHKKVLDSLKVAGKDSTSYNKSEEQNQKYINFNPVMQFKNEIDYLDIVSDIGDLSQTTIFTVYQSDDATKEMELWGLYGEDSNITLTTAVAANPDDFSNYEGGLTKVPVLNTYLQIYHPKNKAAFPNKPRLRLGNFSNNTLKGFKGSIAEIIVYNTLLRGNWRQAIESALALKYGLTLTNGKDYLSSEKKVVYSIKDNENFANYIAGIGRDDSLGLYQKQSHSTEESSLITIGIGAIFPTNNDNNMQLDDNTFLIWGTNNKPLAIEENEKPEYQIPLLQRKWKIQATGEKVSELKTTLQLDISNVFKEGDRDKSEYLMVIDLSGDGTFLSENIKYIEASGLENNILSFEEIQWDTDISGTDVFTFALKENLEVGLTEDQPISCNNRNDGKLLYEVKGGIPPYNYELLASDSIMDQWKSTEAKYPEKFIENLSEDIYRLEVTDAVGTQTEVLYNLEAPTPISVDLGEDREFQFGMEEILLDAAILSEDEITYEYDWTLDGGFYSDQPSIAITTQGIYTVNIISSNGCEASDSIKIEDSSIQSFILFPNQSKDGNYQIQVRLKEKQRVQVHVFDMMGRLIYTMEGKDQSSYNMSGTTILTSGIYNVVLKATDRKASFKLVVE